MKNLSKSIVVRSKPTIYPPHKIFTQTPLFYCSFAEKLWQVSPNETLHCFLLRLCIVSTGSSEVVFHVWCKGLGYKGLLQNWSFHHPANLLFRGSSLGLAMPWRRLLRLSFYNKTHQDEEENILAKTAFYKLQFLKPIIPFSFWVMDGTFVWLLGPHLLDPVSFRDSGFRNSTSSVNSHQQLL